VILVDTSVWIAHLRRGEPKLARLLDDGLVMTHSFVVGELACGSLRNRAGFLSYLGRLATAPEATSQEVRRLVEMRRLMGKGLGWTDVHLLASCLIAGVPLWSLDAPLTRAATQLDLVSSG
jgi:predicted nucleic acid-binding protein